MNTNVAVIGGGSWATANVKMLSNHAGQIHWWVRSADTVQFIHKYKHNPNYLTDVEINLEKVIPTNDIATVLSSSDMVILNIPSAFLMTALKPLTSKDFENKVVFSAIKGIVPEHNLIVGDMLLQHYQVKPQNIGVLTGPCHAEEVALEKLSYLTVACQHKENAVRMADLLACRYIRTTLSDDIYGTEYAAVLKNIYSIAAGIFHGLGYGDNFQAVLISNAVREMQRFIQAVHPITRDINDSAYLGDLLVTAYSQFSRNRMFGAMLGKGYPVKFAQLEMNMIAEGYYAVKCIMEINKKYNVAIPICEAVYRVCYEKIAPRVEMKLLTNHLN
ncbi:MAG: NAD(P)H-dependent glycerol-3-phosphate dehydrogenase [Bacteroidetes bacterium]|nr:NAD(P)H-dependent glycerol-3-phosphate dehydrogenase [Bacteroidota bacterium]